MFGFGSRGKQRRINARPKHVRARDGHQRLAAPTRRAIRKQSGLSNRAYKRVVKENRAYKKGRASYRGRLF